MQTDYLIIGQGICGSFMSYCLMQEGKKVIVMDNALPHSSSRAASGIINPVTGKRLSTTWMADTLIPFAQDIYRQMGDKLQAPLISQCDILEFHPSFESRDLFEERIGEHNQYLSDMTDRSEWEKYFRYNYGMGKISPVWLIDIQMLLSGWRKYLAAQQSLAEEFFEIEYLHVSPDGVRYKDITAEKIIFCEGAYGFDNPYFSLLPYSRNKGEAMLVSIPGLPQTNVYKQDLKIVPWQGDVFWVGAAYEWNFDDVQPTAAFLHKVKSHLDYWLRIPYKIEDHFAAERPATVGHRPFVGLHPVHTSVGLLNGVGTKGCSIAPYLAHQFARHLVHGSPILPEADVDRHRRILSR